MRDNWSPRLSGLSIQTMKCRSRLRWVHQLIDPQSKEWNKQIIDNLFFSFDAEEIYKIRLPSIPMKDTLAWNYEKNGMFSVRSAYSVEWNYQYGSKLKFSNGMGRSTPTLYGVRYGSYLVWLKSKKMADTAWHSPMSGNTH